MNPLDGETTQSRLTFTPAGDPAPHLARRYDYWLGGKDNLAADRASAEAIAHAYPTIRTAAVENRYFLQRVVNWLAVEVGLRQFLDIGTGLPTFPAVHDVAQAVAPTARVVYVDNDPMVICHGRARVNSRPQGAVTYTHGDLRRPDAILTDPALQTHIDLTKPIGVLLTAVLHFLTDTDNPYQAVTSLIHRLPPGSYLALSHATLDPLPVNTATQLTTLSRPDAGHGPFRPRSHNEVAAFISSLDLVEPGLVSIVDWHPDRYPTPDASQAEVATYGAVAHIH